MSPSMCGRAYLLLAKIVRQVGDHDLGLGRDAVLGWTALLARLLGLGLLGIAGVDGHGAFLSSLTSESLVGSRGETSSLARDVGGASAVRVSGSVNLAVGLAGL